MINYHSFLLAESQRAGDFAWGEKLAESQRAGDFDTPLRGLVNYQLLMFND